MERRVLSTPVGGVELWTEDGRLRGLNLTRAGPTQGSGASPLVRELEKYFAGNPVSFDDVRLDLSDSTNFERRVYDATRLVPFGKVASYGQIAAAIEKPGGARAVGQALGNNPVAIVIPCHRIIGSDGSLGGFTGGLHWKKKLLRHEGVLR